MNGQNLPVTISGFYASGTVKTAFIRISEQDFQPFNQSSRTAFYVDADPATLKQLYAELPPSAMAYSLNQAVIDGLQNLLNTQKTIFTLIGLFTLLMAVLMISNQFINTMIQSKFDFAVLKACGVKNMKIKNAFLLEAGIISLTAGLAGTFISFFVAAIGELLVSGYADVPVRFGWFALGCGIALVVACLVTITVSGRLTKVRPAQLLRQG
ncbi:FtsX-like permease family protein [compost metagenome]